jgi:hypothetical protein
MELSSVWRLPTSVVCAWDDPEGLSDTGVFLLCSNSFHDFPTGGSFFLEQSRD